jgi:hypothetical protein
MFFPSECIFDLLFLWPWLPLLCGLFKLKKPQKDMLVFQRLLISFFSKFRRMAPFHELRNNARNELLSALDLKRTEREVWELPVKRVATCFPL